MDADVTRKPPIAEKRESNSSVADSSDLTQRIEVQVFPWSSLLMTGIDEIDEQHEILVGLTNKLASHFVGGADRAAVLDVIDELTDYAVYHFDTEESIWTAELDACDCESHQAAHRIFKENIESLRSQNNDPSWLVERLLNFLTEWLAFHILESDRHMAWMVLAIRQGSNYPHAREQAEKRLSSGDGKLSRVIMTLYRRMATTALSLMRSQELGSRLRSETFQTEKSLLQRDLLRAQKIGRIGSWKFDFSNQELTWSPETYRLFDVPQSEILNLDFFISNVYQADREKVSAAWEAAVRTGKYDIEHRTANSNGQRWVREVAEFEGWKGDVATTAFGTVQDITEKKIYEQKLQALAYSEPLTGLPNKHAMVEWLERHTAAFIQNKQWVCLFIVDLDNMQAVNERLGRDTGDKLLRIVAQRLAQEANASRVAHLGSDQFAIAYLDYVGDDFADSRANKLLSLVHQPLSLESQPIHLSACIGAVRFQGESGATAEGLLRFANLALSRAKMRGPGVCEYADFSEHEASVKETQRIEEVKFGFANDEFRLYCQPKIDLTNGNLIGVEALIRWQHPQKGLLGPDEFLSILDYDPLLIQLGDWVIEKALIQLKEWQDEGLVIPISVNVSSRQLAQPDFAEKISASLARYPEISSKHFEVEFLETGPLMDLEPIKRVLDQLRILGVQASLDDFGTGISSLRVFSFLQMQIIKIDRSFITGMLERREDLAVVVSSLALGQSLGCKVIAEGVETEREVQRLLELGCQYIQGYIAARPMPFPELKIWLEKWQNEPPSWAPWARASEQASCCSIPEGS